MTGSAALSSFVPAPVEDLVELTTLFDVSQALGGFTSLHDGFRHVMALLRRHPGAIRGALTLLDEETGELYIESSLDLPAEARLARYRVGEGITGEVVASGRPIVVPDVAREPRFLHRTLRRGIHPEDAITFACVPILVDHRAVGALSVDLPHRPGQDTEPLVRFLHVVAALLALRLKTQRPLEEENRKLKEELRERYDFSHLIGTSRPMRDVLAQVAQVAGTQTTVLIRGESGTGKELIAHALHYHSPRAAGPFVKVNCAALPETLMESELFGHERGAFTGALSRKAGRFERANGGTIFLDEIGELSPATQSKLLRVLQEREFERVGGGDPIAVDVRIIAATHRDLEQSLKDRTFREDLYYRLNVFPLFLPPLRDRKADILLLADHFVEKYARSHQKQVTRITTPAIDMLMRYHWPGNVRELENVIERSVVVAEGPAIHGRHLPPSLQVPEAAGPSGGAMKAMVERFEADILIDALKQTRGSVGEVTTLLGSTERIIRYKLRKYRIKPGRYS